MKNDYTVSHICGDKWAVEKNAVVKEIFYNEADARARCAELEARENAKKKREVKR